ncbi:MAG: OstA-like protein [Betaproteobacteria bacterium]|nr:OstA-like protein [Betaproteobacteria bacterium]
MRAERLSRLICGLAAAVLIAAAPAHAEKADRNKPIQLEADRVTVDDAKQISTFSGNVVLTQGSMVLRGDKLEVRQDKDGFRQGTIWGNLAYFKQKRDGTDELIEGWSERIEYDSRADKVQMFNRAMLKRGQDEVRGNYISYDANTEFFQVVGGGTKSAAAKPGEGRVRAIMQPKPKDAAPAAGVPLKSDEGPK